MRKAHAWCRNAFYQLIPPESPHVVKAGPGGPKGNGTLAGVAWSAHSGPWIAFAAKDLMRLRFLCERAGSFAAVVWVYPNSTSWVSHHLPVRE